MEFWKFGNFQKKTKFWKFEKFQNFVFGNLKIFKKSLKKEVSHMPLSLMILERTVLRRQTDLEAEILTGVRSRPETFISEVFCYLGRTALALGYPIRLD